MFRHQAKPRGDAVLDVELRDIGALEHHAALERQDAHHGVEQRGLAGAIGADDGDDLAAADLEIDGADSLDLAVGNMGIGNGEQDTHATAPR